MEPADPLEPILTHRLRLRCLREEDAAAFAATLTPDVTVWLNSWPLVVSVELAKRRIGEMRLRMTTAGDLMSFAVERRSDGRILGGVGAMVKATDAAEIGYHLHPDHHGQGYVTEAAAALIATVWRLTKVTRITAAANLANPTSFKVMERLGMTPAGDQPIYSTGRDVWEMCRYYALERPI